MNSLVAEFRRAIGLILWLVIVLGPMRVLAQPSPIPVEVASVVFQTLRDKVSFIATLEPNVATTVGAIVPGRVVRSDVREGDHVVLGTVLMQLDRTAREIALRETRAAVEKARQEWEKLRRGYRSEEVAQRRAEVEEQRALLARAKQDFLRAERLYRDELISLADLQRLQSEYLAVREKQERARAALQLAEAGPRKEEIARARAEFREAKARYDLVAYELDQTTLRAPLTGFLVKKYVEVGTWVNPGDPVADLVDLDPVYATGPVGERKIDFLQGGLPAAVIVDALPGRSFQGTVAHIIPQADPQSRTFPVKIRIPNPDGRLKGGMLARVTVEVGGGRRGFLVPKDALVRRGGGDVVFIVEDGLARQ
ncbi:MAG: efflux RND transporter periplasmic adaptor subunit [Candidatus Binatia bacterium]